MENNLPFEHSYWVEAGKLLAGRYPGAEDADEMRRRLTGLIAVGIRHVINLQEADEVNYKGKPFVPYADALATIARAHGTTATMIRMPIRDLSVPTREQMRAILDEIDRAIAQGLPVYVHCWGGKGRTGTVVGCYLARHGIAAGDDALRMVQELRRDVPDVDRPSPETPRQFEMVRTWKCGE